jgi:hypothetical protein
MEEGVMAVPAGTGKAWANRGMREARSTEAWSANMGKARTAHATYMHAAEATGVHTATEMPTTAEMSAATEAAMSATAETTTAVTAPTTATGKHRRSERHHRGDRQRREAFENPIVHRSILRAARRYFYRARRIR